MYQSYGDIVDKRFLAMPSDHDRVQTFVAVHNALQVLEWADMTLEKLDEVIQELRAEQVGD